MIEWLTTPFETTPIQLLAAMILVNIILWAIKQSAKNL